MKAVVYDKSHRPVPLILSEVPTPEQKNNEVLVKIAASSLNALDYRPIKMGFPFKPGQIFGADMAGTVVSRGSAATRFHEGDRVFADLSPYGSGAFAEFVCVPERALVKIPDEVGFEAAATLPVAGLTALQALRKSGMPLAGKKVLVYGASGGVGTFAVQLAKAEGAVVTAVGSTKNEALIRSLGADAFIDYKNTDVTKTKERYDVILGVNGYQPLSKYRRILADHGVFVLVGGSMKQVLKTILFGSLLSWGSKKFHFLAAKANVADLETLMKGVAAGTIRPVISDRFTLDEFEQAYALAAAGHAKGKIVLTIHRE